MTKNGNTLSWRVTELEKITCGLDGKVDSILQNHLPHLDKKIDSLKTRIDTQTAIQVGAIIVGALMLKYL